MSGVRHRPSLCTSERQSDLEREAGDNRRPLSWFRILVQILTPYPSVSPLLGITLGRTQLFALSPKKTVEGFVGALFSTLFFGFLVSIQFILYYTRAY